MQQGTSLHELQVPQQVRVKRPEHLTSLFRRFLDDQETVGVEDLSASMLTMLMLHEVAASAPAQSAPQSAASILAGQANTLIRTQFHKPLSTSSLARQLHCNPDYLGRVFRQVYGHTVTEAIHQRRLKRACRLLLESNRTVEQIAYDCGFKDVTYFRHLFKRTEAITPRKFRKLYAHLHVNTG